MRCKISTGEALWAEVSEAVKIICDSLHLKNLDDVACVPFLQRTMFSSCFSLLACHHWLSITTNSSFFVLKKRKSFKAFCSYLLLTAVVLNKVKQMMLLILHFQRILAKP